MVLLVVGCCCFFGCRLLNVGDFLTPRLLNVGCCWFFNPPNYLKQHKEDPRTNKAPIE